MPSTAAAPYRGLRGQRLDQAAASLAGSGTRHQADSTASPFAFSRSKNDLGSWLPFSQTYCAIEKQFGLLALLLTDVPSGAFLRRVCCTAV
ncbi:hypothetical protein MJO28_006543, partial [Puccinia striiformis f. sp. tritici]